LQHEIKLFTVQADHNSVPHLLMQDAVLAMNTDHPCYRECLSFASLSLNCSSWSTFGRI